MNWISPEVALVNNSVKNGFASVLAWCNFDYDLVFWSDVKNAWINRELRQVRPDKVCLIEQPADSRPVAA